MSEEYKVVKNAEGKAVLTTSVTATFSKEELEKQLKDVTNNLAHLEAAKAQWMKIKEKLEAAGLKISAADLEMVAKEKVSLAGEDLDKVLKIFDLLDDISDLSDYYTNLE